VIPTDMLVLDCAIFFLLGSVVGIAGHMFFLDHVQRGFKKEREKFELSVEDANAEQDGCGINGCGLKTPHDHIYENKQWNVRSKCPVNGCKIKMPHSHTEALLRRMKGQ
jgi:hypothetical protein